MSEHTRRIRSTRTAQPIPFASPPGVHWEGPDLVSLRTWKAALTSLEPDHPLRTALAAQPDEIPRAEYHSKVGEWRRLLRGVVSPRLPGGFHG
jgi:hypothetical protein